jgi:hypothetical protein
MNMARVNNNDEIKRLSAAHDNFLQTIQDHLGDSFKLENDRIVLVIAWWRIAYETHMAITLLISNGLNGAAAALMRPIFEATVRALWINKCASDNDVQRFQTGANIFPEMKIMMEGIDKEYLTEKFFLEMKKASWGRLNDFAHNGYLQTVRCFEGDTIKSSFTDSDIKQILNFASSIVQLFSVGFARIIKREEAARKIEAIRHP